MRVNQDEEAEQIAKDRQGQSQTKQKRGNYKEISKPKHKKMEPIKTRVIDASQKICR